MWMSRSEDFIIHKATESYLNTCDIFWGHIFSLIYGSSAGKKQGKLVDPRKF